MIHLHRRLGPELLASLRDPYAQAMQSQGFERFVQRVGTVPDLTVFEARVEGELAGIKVGFSYQVDRYHSWVGFVRPAFQGRGIARALMHAQHAWARKAGYRLVRTRSFNRFAAMLHLNLSEGFSLVGTLSQGGPPKLVLTKSLVEAPPAAPAHPPPELPGFQTRWGWDRVGLSQALAAGGRILGVVTLDAAPVALLRFPAPGTEGA